MDLKCPRVRVHAARRMPLTALLAAALLAPACAPLIRAFMRPIPPPAEHLGWRVQDVPEAAVHVVAEGLEVPWAVAFLPDGGLLVTERPGRLVRLPAPRAGGPPLRRDDGEAWEIPGVHAVGEGGLMGLALHPRVAETGWIYLMLTATGPEGAENRVERFRLTGEGLVERRVIVDGIPAARWHNGGALAFGPDGYLYVAAGDARRAELAQDPASPAGSILRLTEEGESPRDNPGDGPVWSWGHRNVQGLAWDDEGRLWATEHGRSGLRSGLDELNLIEPGRNYGWPAVEGDEHGDPFEAPVLHSGPDYTWAPAGAAWLDGSLFFGGLRGEALYQAHMQGDEVLELRAHFYGEFGRIRAVTVGPDGGLYFTTSNRDGRGRARGGDDRIVRIGMPASAIAAAERVLSWQPHSNSSGERPER